MKSSTERSNDLKNLLLSFKLAMETIVEENASFEGSGNYKKNAEYATEMYSKSELSIAIFFLLRVMTDDEAIEDFRRTVRALVVAYELDQAVEEG